MSKFAKLKAVVRTSAELHLETEVRLSGLGARAERRAEGHELKDRELAFQTRDLRATPQHRPLSRSTA